MTSVLSTPASWPLPTYRHRPLGRISSPGPAYIRNARNAGLFLDDQQCEFLDEALAIGRDGYPLATQVLYIVPRQNGKDAILEALELGDLFLAGIPLIINTTHRYATTMEHYFRVAGLVRENPEMYAQVGDRGFHTANGNCAIELLNGNRLKFLARSGGNARGFAGVRRLILNEAMILAKSFMGDSSPTGLTRRDRQTWFTASPPRAYSEVLHAHRQRAIEGGADAKRLLAWIYENEPGTPVRVDGELNLEALARVNPAFPERITVEAFEDTLTEMASDEEFAIECMGVPEFPDGIGTMIGEKLWAGCLDPQPFPLWVFAADVAYDRQSASIVGAGINEDGNVQVEVIPPRADGTEPPAGVEWVVPRLVELAERHKPQRIVIDPKVSGSMLDDLLKAGLPLTADLERKLERNEITRKTYDRTPSVLTMGTTDVARAAGAFFDAVLARTVAHRGQVELDHAVFGAISRPLADAWAWDRRKSEGDVTPLIAATLAHFAVVQLGERTKPKARVVNLAEAMAQLDQETKDSTDG